MIRIRRGISIRDNEIQIRYVHASGPGGQNVNKVATACQLRFDAMTSESLPQAVKDRLQKLAGQRITADGTIIIDARRYRSQQRNLDDATDRLRTLLLRAASPPKPRRKTKPTLASKTRRLESKRQRSQTKNLRHKNVRNDE